MYEKIKKACVKKGISIRALEQRAGIGNGVIAGWKESSPRVDNLQAVAEVLGMTVDELIKK